MKSFLAPEEIKTAQSILFEQKFPAVNQYIDRQLMAKLSKDSLWEKSKPIALGSWARGELCAKSDIDLIFLGEESTVKEFLSDRLAQGMKIRSRIPLNLKDWSEGVQPFDVLALLTARSFFPSERKSIDDQIALIQKKGPSFQKELMRAMLLERRSRNVRYDSISNYLEPNIKYGPGGLRDLEQALMIYDLFGDKWFPGPQPNVERLQLLKSYLVQIRQWLHLNGFIDVIVSQTQADLAHFFNFKSAQDFMSKVQYRFREVSFYSEWFADVAMKPPRAIKKIRTSEIKSYRNLIESLLEDSSPVMQEFVRKRRKAITLPPKSELNIHEFLNSNMSEDFLNALFRAHILEEIFTDLMRLRGLVQHDQYHRYSVDAHTLQAVRQVLRLKKQPKVMGALSTEISKLKKEEWEILFWTALYHDLGKGLKADHSDEGQFIVNRDFEGFGFSKKLAEEVAWMVKNHLLISTAAFRQNPKSPRTWSELFNRGVRGKRIVLLAVFTGVDIIATNPEAWNEWKRRLLTELVEALQSPNATRLHLLVDQFKKHRMKVDRELIEGLDSAVIEGVRNALLISDLKALVKSRGNLSPLVSRNRKGEIWIRLHHLEDRPGVFLNYAYLLHKLGFSVQQAFAQTHPQWGVYDWFKVRTQKSTAVIKKNIQNAISEMGIEYLAHEIQLDDGFDAIEIVSRDRDTAIISFRGRDRRGALVAAARAIYNAGLEIINAKVHTWGRQIDDVFTVKLNDEGLNRLTKGH